MERRPAPHRRMPRSPRARRSRVSTLTARRLLAALIGTGFLVLPGCLVAAAAAGAGTYAYITGTLEADLQAPLDKAHGATLRALSGLGFTDVHGDTDALEGSAQATMADGTRVSVKLIRRTETVTQAGIRVGIIGDEKHSSSILEAIRKEL